MQHLPVLPLLLSSLNARPPTSVLKPPNPSLPSHLTMTTASLVSSSMQHLPVFPFLPS